MIRIKKNKPQISPDTRSFRQVRRLNLNRTYIPLKIGIIVGYILLGMLSASTSMFGILLGTMLRYFRLIIFRRYFLKIPVFLYRETILPTDSDTTI